MVVVRTALLASGVYATGNPQIQNVIGMLGTMKSTCQSEINEQEKAWVEFKQWCDDTHKSKEKEISQLSIDLDEAKAGSMARKADIGTESAERDTAITTSKTMKDDLRAMLKQREAAHAAYKAKKAELSQSIEACEQASEVLSNVPKGAAATDAGTALLQSGVLNTIQNKKGSSFTVLKSLIEMAETPQGKNYAVQKSSGVIIQMIEDLKDSLTEELNATEKSESDSSESYEMEKQAVESIDAEAIKLSTQKIAAVAQAEGEKALFDSDVQTFSQSLAGAKDYSRKLGSECGIKANDYIREAKARADELTAIDQAVEILSGAAVSKAGEVLSPPAPGEGESMFLQLAATSDSNKKKLISYLRSKARRIGSQALMQLAQAAEADPFGKIKKLVGDLITQLTAERRAEIEKANQCETDLAESARKIEDAANDVNKLSTDQISLESQIESKGKEIEEKIGFLANSDNSLAELRKARAAESATNEKAIRESSEGAEALAGAIGVLQDFYDKANAESEDSSTTPLNTQFEPSKQYGGSDASTGILTLLTQIETDMRTLVSETSAAEKTAKAEFTEQDRELTVASAAAKTDLNTFRGQIATMKEDLTETKESLESAKDDLKKETEYKATNLDAKCIDTGVSFEDRASKREEEIESLQDALKILEQVSP